MLQAGPLIRSQDDWPLECSFLATTSAFVSVVALQHVGSSDVGSLASLSQLLALRGPGAAAPEVGPSGSQSAAAGTPSLIAKAILQLLRDVLQPPDLLESSTDPP